MTPRPEHAEKIKTDKTKDEAGWNTDDLDFDDEGNLYIKNVALARAIEKTRRMWGGLLYMYRDEFLEEKKATGDTAGETKTDGTTVEGPKANMLCPCEPTP